jgi:uncharacterized protein
MPVALTYPGVYVEEVPSGVRTIAGVPTSTTAFIGRARRGPTNLPVVLNSYGDFERRFGRLWNDSTLSFAVRDFFLNGGGQAVVVRLFHPSFADEAARLAALAAATAQAQTAADAVEAAAVAAVAGAPDAQAVADAALAAVAAAGAPGPVALAAATAAAAAGSAAVAGAAAPGDVATAITAAEAGVVAAAAAPAAPVTRARLAVDTLALEAAYEGTWANSLRARVDYDTAVAGLFNLSVRDGGTGDVETHRNLSVDPANPRCALNVLAAESRLVRVFGALPPARPAASTAPAAGADPFGATTSSGVTTQASDGVALSANDYLGSETAKTGIFALAKADIFNLLCVPPYTPATDVEPNVWAAAAAYCERRRAVLIVDPPSNWTTKDLAVAGVAALGTTSANAALYFPRVRMVNTERDNQVETFAPCGVVAGVIARTDSQRGVWKAPAGQEATLVGVPELAVGLTDAENGELNPLGVNCLRAMQPAGRLVWGARTRQGADALASQWKYLPVRRMALYIEEALYRGTQWVVFEPNDEPLWAQIRLNIGAFMQGLFRQGAFQGSKPSEAYLVKCDRETTTQDDINRGIVNIVVGFAPLKPAEFVVIKLQQLAGQVQA